MFRHHEGFALLALTAVLTALFAPIGVQATAAPWWLALPASAAIAFVGAMGLFWLLAWLGR